MSSAPAAKAPPVKAAPEKGEKKEKKAGVKRSNFSDIYPREAVMAITTAEGKNPKRPGSKAFDVFELYRTHKTVGAFLDNGGNYNDIAYNVGRNFIKVG